MPWLGQIMGTGVIMQTGTSMSDAAGDFSATLPRAFTLRTLSFDVDGKSRRPWSAVRGDWPGDPATAGRHHRRDRHGYRRGHDYSCCERRFHLVRDGDMMRNFRLIHAGLDVAPILAELEAAPEWGHLHRAQRA